jgi:hypothetical protein
MVGERQNPVADDLAGFMAFSGHDEHVPCAKFLHGRVNSL